MHNITTETSDSDKVMNRNKRGKLSPSLQELCSLQNADTNQPPIQNSQHLSEDLIFSPPLRVRSLNNISDKLQNPKIENSESYPTNLNSPYIKKQTKYKINSYDPSGTYTSKLIDSLDLFPTVNLKPLKHHFEKNNQDKNSPTKKESQKNFGSLNIKVKSEPSLEVSLTPAKINNINENINKSKKNKRRLAKDESKMLDTNIQLRTNIKIGSQDTSTSDDFLASLNSTKKKMRRNKKVRRISSSSSDNTIPPASQISSTPFEYQNPPDSWEDIIMDQTPQHNCGPDLPCSLFPSDQVSVIQDYVSEHESLLSLTPSREEIESMHQSSGNFFADNEKFTLNTVKESTVPFIENMRIDQESQKRPLSDSESEKQSTKNFKPTPKINPPILLRDQPKVILTRCDQNINKKINLNPNCTQKGEIDSFKKIEQTHQSTYISPASSPTVSSDEEVQPREDSSDISDEDLPSFDDLQSEDGSIQHLARTQAYFSTKNMRSGVWIRKSPAKKVEDYIPAVQALVGDEEGTIIQLGAPNIRRLEFYLRDEGLARICIERGLTVEGEHIPVYGLVDRATRIVLSQVPHWFPSSLLVEALSTYGQCTTSNITSLKLSVPFKGMRNVLSFRREALLRISPHHQTLPKSIEIIFEERKYYFPVVEGRVTCYACNSKGHIAARCPHQKIVSSPSKQIIAQKLIENQSNSAQPQQKQTQPPQNDTKIFQPKQRKKIVLKNLSKTPLPLVDKLTTIEKNNTLDKSKVQVQKPKTWAQVSAHQPQDDKKMNYKDIKIRQQNPAPLMDIKVSNLNFNQLFIGDKLTVRRMALPEEKTIKTLVKPTGEVIQWSSFRPKFKKQTFYDTPYSYSYKNLENQESPALLKTFTKADDTKTFQELEEDSDTNFTKEHESHQQNEPDSKLKVPRHVNSTRDRNNQEILTIKVQNEPPYLRSIPLNIQTKTFNNEEFPDLPTTKPLTKLKEWPIKSIEKAPPIVPITANFQDFAKLLTKTALQRQADGVQTQILKSLDAESIKAFTQRYSVKLDELGLIDEIEYLLKDVIDFYAAREASSRKFISNTMGKRPLKINVKTHGRRGNENPN